MLIVLLKSKFKMWSEYQCKRGQKGDSSCFLHLQNITNGSNRTLGSFQQLIKRPWHMVNYFVRAPSTPPISSGLFSLIFVTAISRSPWYSNLTLSSILKRYGEGSASASPPASRRFLFTAFTNIGPSTTKGRSVFVGLSNSS